MNIRTANEKDAPRLLEIYSPIVKTTAISFEYEPPTVNEFASRIETANKSHCWIVGEHDNKIVGYGYATPLRAREAYRFSVETSVYIDEPERRKGYAKLLYADLFQRLSKLGYKFAFAGIALPNEASVGLHKSIGFEYQGTFNTVGYKFDQWHDVSWWRRPIADEDG